MIILYTLLVQVHTINLLLEVGTERHMMPYETDKGRLCALTTIVQSVVSVRLVLSDVTVF
jgi:hypothetical protein